MFLLVRCKSPTCRRQTCCFFDHHLAEIVEEMPYPAGAAAAVLLRVIIGEPSAVGGFRVVLMPEARREKNDFRCV